jgi:hypothetical protein
MPPLMSAVYKEVGSNCLVRKIIDILHFFQHIPVALLLTILICVDTIRIGQLICYTVRLSQMSEIFDLGPKRQLRHLL